MAGEASIRSSLQINKGNLKYRSYPTNFTADVSTAAAPTPGGFLATVEGVDVDLSQITTPGFCRIANLDATNFVEYGIWDGVEFHPFGEVGPGEFYTVKLSRHFGNTYGTGTGTLDMGETFRVKADTADCEVNVEVFEK